MPPHQLYEHGKWKWLSCQEGVLSVHTGPYRWQEEKYYWWGRIQLCPQRAVTPWVTIQIGMLATRREVSSVRQKWDRHTERAHTFSLPVSRRDYLFICETEVGYAHGTSPVFRREVSPVTRKWDRHKERAHTLEQTSDRHAERAHTFICEAKGRWTQCEYIPWGRSQIGTQTHPR